MRKGYFQKVKEETPTRLWINNPTIEQAYQALEIGAVGCTTNPSYVSKLFSSPEDFNIVRRTTDFLVRYIPDNSVVASVVQRFVVSRISDIFMPIYKASKGKEGFVTIQGNPNIEEDYRCIVDEAIENRMIAENIIIKIPVTEAGIKAIFELVQNNIPIMATEIMGLSQAVSICEAYSKAVSSSGYSPPFFVTHITGILDDHFTRIVQEQHLDIPKDILRLAGISIAKAQYLLMKEKKYPGTMIGGGARKLEDFTELVGGELHVTMNWVGSIDRLLEIDPPVVDRILDEVDLTKIEYLVDKLPDYARTYKIDGMKPYEYFDFGGVELFRSSFINGWKILTDFIDERRRSI